MQLESRIVCVQVRTRPNRDGLDAVSFLAPAVQDRTNGIDQ